MKLQLISILPQISWVIRELYFLLRQIEYALVLQRVVQTLYTQVLSASLCNETLLFELNASHNTLFETKFVTVIMHSGKKVV